MPAAIDATVGGTTANSYLTINAATTISEAMIGTLAWTAATTDNRTRALITATNGLETLGWIGTRSTTTQRLSWPREDATCGDKHYASTVIPREIELATFDLANALLSDPTLLRGNSAEASSALVPGVPNRDLRRLKLDVMELEWRTDTTLSTTMASTPLTVLPHLASILGCLTTSTTKSGMGALCAVQRS